MAPKAVKARKRFDRNQRFRGHGPLLQFAVDQPPVIGATVSVGGAHGPESGECKEALRPEPSLSRPWAAATGRATTARDRGDVFCRGPVPPQAVDAGGHRRVPAALSCASRIRAAPTRGGCKESLPPEPWLSRAPRAPAFRPFRLPAPDRFRHLYPPTAPILFDVEAKTLLRSTGYPSREPCPR